MKSKPLSSEEAREGECTRCGSVGRVWPIEQPAEIVLELEWGYEMACLDCWHDLGEFFGGVPDDTADTEVNTDG